jgi:hypothetical protein
MTRKVAALTWQTADALAARSHSRTSPGQRHVIRPIPLSCWTRKLLPL